MLCNAAVVTSSVVLASVLSKSALSTTTSHGARQHAHDLARKAVHLKDVSLQDTSPVLRLQHAAQASAYLAAARLLVDGEELEYMLGMDVSRLEKTVESILAETRDALRPSLGAE